MASRVKAALNFCAWCEAEDRAGFKKRAEVRAVGAMKAEPGQDRPVLCFANFIPSFYPLAFRNKSARGESRQ